MNKVAVPWNPWNSITEVKLTAKFLWILLQMLKSEFLKILNAHCCVLLLVVCLFPNWLWLEYWNIKILKYFLISYRKVFSLLLRFPIETKSSKPLHFLCSSPCVKLCLYHWANDICPSFCHFFCEKTGFITWYSLEYHITWRISVSTIPEQSELLFIFCMFSLG